MFCISIHCYHHLSGEETSLDELGERIMSAFTDQLNAKVNEIKLSLEEEKARVDGLLDSMTAQIADLKEAVESGAGDPVVLDGLNDIKRTLDDFHAEGGTPPTPPPPPVTTETTTAPGA